MFTDMKTRLREIWALLLRSPREFPMEALMGLVCYFNAAWNLEHETLDGLFDGQHSILNPDILCLFVPLMALTYWVNRLRQRAQGTGHEARFQWAYVASGLLFLPLTLLNLQPFLWTMGFFFTYVLGAMLLIVGTHHMDNRPFASHALHVCVQMIVGVIIAGLLNLVVSAVVASFLYIFGINTPRYLYLHILLFVWLFIAPQVCCTLMAQDYDDEAEPIRPLRIVLDYILSPAIVVYTVILYAYFIKIAILWDLPKGGVAWMVMGFMAAALVGRLMQYVLRRPHFEWFYRHLPAIAIGPLIMYWVGSMYRIRLYGLTESRIYLLIAGTLMSMFVLMLIGQRTRRFQTMAVMTMLAIVVFTYIPGITAKSIGLRNQTHRMERLIDEVHLTLTHTGKFPGRLDLEAIKKDSLLSCRYQELSSIIEYVREGMGSDAFEHRYGRWKYSERDFATEKVDNGSVEAIETIERDMPICLDGYSVMLPRRDFTCRYDDDKGTVYVRRNDRVVLRYPIDSLVQTRPALLDEPESLLTYHNDSVMVVLSSVTLCNSKVKSATTYDAMVFVRELE